MRNLFDHEVTVVAGGREIVDGNDRPQAPPEEPGLGQIIPSPVTAVAPLAIAALLVTYNAISNAIIGIATQSSSFVDGAVSWYNTQINQN